jgi:hypothetical protein
MLVAVAVAVIPRTRCLAGIISVLAAFFVATTDAGAYHYLWIVPFGLIAGQRWFVVALVSASTANYLVLSFVRCSIVCAEPNAFTDFLADRGWLLGVAEWGVVAAWLAWGVRAAVLRAGAPAPAPAVAVPA